MRVCEPQTSRERGGVTILVALSMLVLLTVLAMGSSRNSIRDVVISGTMRQGAMARNAGDSGIEWSLHWMHDDNGAAAKDSSLRLRTMKNALLMDGTLSGVARELYSSDPAKPDIYKPDAGVEKPDLELKGVKDHRQFFTMGITRMGKLPVTDNSQGVGPGTYTPAAGGEAKQAPDLWAIRSDGKVVVGGLTFRHAKEAWISTPVQK